MGLQPTQGDENRVGEGWVGNYTYFVISTGAKRSGEICGFPHLAQKPGAPYLTRSLRQM